MDFFDREWWAVVSEMALDWLRVSGWRIALIVILLLVGWRVGRLFVRRTVALGLRYGGEDTLREISMAKRRETLTQLLNAVLWVVVILIGLLMIFRELRLEIAPLLASAGVVGIAVGFGAQSLVKDVISGAFIIFENQFDVGDVIRIGDAAGLVEQINLRTTVLRDLSGTVHIIPNGEISRVSVLTKEWSRLVLDIDVAYRENVDHVIDITKRVLDRYAEENSAIVLEPPQVLGVEKLGENSVTIRALLKTLPVKQWEAGRELRKRIKAEFDTEGIEIPFPQRSVWLQTPLEVKNEIERQRAEG